MKTGDLYETTPLYHLYVRVKVFLFSQFFEKQELERINSLRNVVWVHLNHLSQQCVTSDEVTLTLKNHLRIGTPYLTLQRSFDCVCLSYTAL